MDNEFILDRLQIEAAPFALCELNGRCDLGMDKDANATLHYVLSGTGEIVIPGQASLPLSRGTLVLVPALRSHVLRSFGSVSQPAPHCQPAGLNIVHLVHGSGDAPQDGRMIALCVRVSLTLNNLGNVIDLIREPILGDVVRTPDLAVPIEQILREIAEPTLGSNALIRALLLQAMIGLLRRYMVDSADSVNWMAALQDPRLAPVLRTLLENPGAEHSLERLAAEAGMSRSNLAQRFSDAYGAGPMELLRDLRMQRAADQLVNTDLPVKRISMNVGFRSRTAFTRAFEAATGQSPRAFRMSRSK